jgi:6-phosphogluconolactonase
MRVRVFEGPDGIAEFAATTIARKLKGATGRVTFGLAGGSTPRTTYTRLLQEEVDWSSVDAWVADERWVAPDHPDNNMRMARDILLDRVPARAHPVPWSAELDPEEAARRYEQTLFDILPDVNGVPHPDLVLLGIGADGHTASLFPGTAALEVSDRWFVANWVPDQDSWRLTATLPLLHAARDIIFLASGRSKASALARILRGDDRPAPPARLVMEGAADVTWLIDRAAAAELGDYPVEYV